MQKWGGGVGFGEVQPAHHHPPAGLGHRIHKEKQRIENTIPLICAWMPQHCQIPLRIPKGLPQCYGLNCVPIPKICSSPNYNISESDLIRKQGLYRYNQVKRRSATLSRTDLIQYGCGILISREDIHREAHRKTWAQREESCVATEVEIGVTPLQPGNVSPAWEHPGLLSDTTPAWGHPGLLATPEAKKMAWNRSSPRGFRESVALITP